MTFEDCWGRQWPISVADLMTATDERVWDRISGYTMFSTHLGNQTWKVTNPLGNTHNLEYPRLYPDKTYDHYLTIMTLLRRYV